MLRSTARIGFRKAGLAALAAVCLLFGGGILLRSALSAHVAGKFLSKDHYELRRLQVRYVASDDPAERRFGLEEVGGLILGSSSVLEELDAGRVLVEPRELKLEGRAGQLLALLGGFSERERRKFRAFHRGRLLAAGVEEPLGRDQVVAWFKEHLDVEPSTDWRPKSWPGRRDLLDEHLGWLERR